MYCLLSEDIKEKEYSPLSRLIKKALPGCRRKASPSISMQPSSEPAYRY